MIARVGRNGAYLLAVTAVVVATILFVPDAAYADGVIETAIKNVLGMFLTGILSGMINIISWATSALMDMMTPLGKLKVSGWDSLMSGFYTFAMNAQARVVVPAAMQILSLCMMLRILNITKMAESQDTSPLAARVVVTLLAFFFGAFLVTNSGAVVTVGYDLMQAMINALGNTTFQSDWLQLASVTQDDFVTASGDVNMSNIIVCLVGALLMVVASLLAVIVALFMFWAKIIKMYIQAFFAPLGVACLFLEPVRQWGLGFIKNVAVNLLALVVIVFVVNLFPYAIEAVMGTAGFSGRGYNDVFVALAGAARLDAFVGIIALVVVYLLLVFMLVKSSSLAREVLGG